jgi:L-asparaginase II
VVRDGALDALHCGHVAVVDGDGTVLAGAGDPDAVIYPRSALKPFQAAASLEAIAPAPPTDEVALMAASHTGSLTHQAVVLRVLDRAGLTPGALRCPHALPVDAAALRQRPEPTRLAHNCSGKHAGFLLSTRERGADVRHHLDADAPVQRAVLRRVRDACATPPHGPGVDGCGAPAWRLPVVALAHGFARLAQVGDDHELAQVAVAMRTHPELIGGPGLVDTELMRCDRRVLAKRGAEGVLGIAVQRPPGAVGVAIKVSDGGARALGPIAAAVLQPLGIAVPVALARPEVLGGGQPHGALEPAAGLVDALSALRA